MDPSIISQLLQKFRGQSQQQPQQQMPPMAQADPSSSPLQANIPLEQAAQAQGQPPMPAPGLTQNFGLLNLLRNMRNQQAVDIGSIRD